MAGNSKRRGAVRKEGTKKGPTVGSGGVRRRADAGPQARQVGVELDRRTVEDEEGLENAEGRIDRQRGGVDGRSVPRKPGLCSSLGDRRIFAPLSGIVRR